MLAASNRIRIDPEQRENAGYRSLNAILQRIGIVL